MIAINYKKLLITENTNNVTDNLNQTEINFIRKFLTEMMLILYQKKIHNMHMMFSL